MTKIISSLLLCGLLVVSFGLGNANATSVYKIGDIKVVAIQDKVMQMDPNFFATSAENKAKYTPTGVCEASLNVFIVDDGKTVSLIDTGFGALGDGKMFANMVAAGYTADMIDNIIITHMHGDHISGALVKNGDKFTKAFKNAKIYIPQDDYAFWVDAPLKEGKTTLATNFADTYKGSIHLFVNNTPVVKGITPMPAYGHTVGHTMYEISSNGQEMLIIADLIHCLAIQINDVNATVKFDTNPSNAIESRKRVLQYVAENNILIGGMHIPAPGVGYVTEKDGKYTFDMKK